MMPTTTEAQAAQLLQAKAEVARKAGGEPCANPKCPCAACTCGPGCTCNVSPDVTCDPCRDLKAQGQAENSDAERLEAGQAFFEEYVRAIPVKHITVAELSGAELLVDCRTAAELAVSTIPGAVPLADLEATPALGHGKKIVCFCTVGGRSGKVAERLGNAGNLELSIAGWCHAGRPLALPGGGETKRVHTFKEKFAQFFPNDCVCVY